MSALRGERIRKRPAIDVGETQDSAAGNVFRNGAAGEGYRGHGTDSRHQSIRPGLELVIGEIVGDG